MSFKVKQAWRHLDHHLHHRLQTNAFQPDDRYLLCVSGGPDSLAMLVNFQRVLADSQLVIFHFHHGTNKNREFRDRAEHLVCSVGKRLKLPVFVKRRDGSAKLSDDEASLRASRYAAAREVAHAEGCGAIVTAHHSQDLLETRFLRLLRGTGPQGLPSIRSRSGLFFRPYLDVSPGELHAALDAEMGVEAGLQDPTNFESTPLRNWLRNELWPRLEAKRPGSLANLAKSLARLSSERRPSPVSAQNPFYFHRYQAFTEVQKFEKIAKIYLRFRRDGFHQGHLKEVKKRLDIPKISHSFSVGGLVWKVNAGQVKVELTQSRR